MSNPSKKINITPGPASRGLTLLSGLLLLALTPNVLSASPVVERAMTILRGELSEGGGEAAYPVDRLLPAHALGAGDVASRREAIAAFIAGEWTAFVSGGTAGQVAGACAAVVSRIESTPVPGGQSSPQTRADDIRFFREHSASRTCWQNGANAMISELRQVFFVPKREGVTAEQVFEVITSFERSPNQAFELHYYEYPNALDLRAGEIIASNRQQLAREPMPLREPIVIKKCLTVDISGIGATANKYCNTMVHRAYSLSENAFLLSTQLYNIALGDRTFTVDANNNSSGMAEFGRNTAHAYSSAYLVIDQGTQIAVHNLGVQVRNEGCPGGFRRGHMQDGQVQEFAKLREMIERELRVSVQTCR